MEAFYMGIAFGAGVGVYCIFAKLINILFRLLNKKFPWHRKNKIKKLVLKEVDIEGFQKRFTTLLENRGISVRDVGVEKKETGYNYLFLIEMPENINEESILALSKFKSKIAMNF